jgi:hypothetical protein
LQLHPASLLNFPYVFKSLFLDLIFMTNLHASGRLTHISVGPAGVWGISPKNEVCQLFFSNSQIINAQHQPNDSHNLGKIEISLDDKICMLYL